MDPGGGGTKIPNRRETAAAVSSQPSIQTNSVPQVTNEGAPQSSIAASSLSSRVAAPPGSRGDILSRIRTFVFSQEGKPSTATQALSTVGGTVAALGIIVGTAAGITAMVLIYMRSGRRQQQRILGGTTAAPQSSSLGVELAAGGGGSAGGAHGSLSNSRGSSTSVSQVSSGTAQARTTMWMGTRGGGSGSAV